MIDPFFYKVMAAGAVAGASTGVLGVFVVGMRIPFLGVCVAHAALAGAIFGALAGLPQAYLLLPAMGGAVVTALLLGGADLSRLRMDTNALMSLLFSLSMGLAFLGLGLFSRLDRPVHDVLALLWGNLLFCRRRDLLLMTLAGVALLAFILMFYKELRAILFSRADAAAAGVRVGLVWTLFLVLSSAVLTVNFQTVGGLMIYSLMVNPAAAAFQVTSGMGRVLTLAAVLGACSGLFGFILALWLDLPVGAVIVIVSSLLVAAAGVTRHFRR